MASGSGEQPPVVPIATDDPMHDHDIERLDLVGRLCDIDETTL